MNLFLQTPDSVETVARGVADGSGASRFLTAIHPLGAEDGRDAAQAGRPGYFVDLSRPYDLELFPAQFN